MAIIFPTSSGAEYDADEESDLSNDDYALAGGRMQNFSASIGGVLRHRRTHLAAASAAAIALLVVAAAMASQPRGEPNESGFAQSPPSQQYTAAGIAALSDSLGAGVSPTRDSAERAAALVGPTEIARTRPDVKPAAVAPARTPTTDNRAPAEQSAVIPALPRPIAGVSNAQLDAAMRAASPGKAPAVAISVPAPAFTPSGGALGTVTYDAAPAVQTQPTLMGDVPRIPYPQNMRGQGRVSSGKVVIQFSVDTLGHPVMATLEVVHSDHELFTAAVRRAVPSMRFVPGQYRGQKLAGKVQVPFYFSATKEQQ